MVEYRRHLRRKSLLLEFEIQRRAFHLTPFYVAQLQLHLIAEQATVDLEGGLSLSTSQDVLFAIADGVGPAKSLIALGYAGWEAGQLEAELADNAWLTCPFDTDILFNTSSELRLDAAAKHLGVNLSLLTSQAGHA